MRRHAIADAVQLPSQILVLAEDVEHDPVGDESQQLAPAGTTAAQAGGRHFLDFGGEAPVCLVVLGDVPRVDALAAHQFFFAGEMPVGIITQLVEQLGDSVRHLVASRGQQWGQLVDALDQPAMLAVHRFDTGFEVRIPTQKGHGSVKVRACPVGTSHAAILGSHAFQG
nr:hypothetical protein [Accumulibacter sp.]